MTVLMHCPYFDTYIITRNDCRARHLYVSICAQSVPYHHARRKQTYTPDTLEHQKPPDSIIRTAGCQPCVRSRPRPRRPRSRASPRMLRSFQHGPDQHARGDALATRLAHPWPRPAGFWARDIYQQWGFHSSFEFVRIVLKILYSSELVAVSPRSLTIVSTQPTLALPTTTRLLAK